jgi:hypothetical protein
MCNYSAILCNDDTFTQVRDIIRTVLRHLANALTCENVYMREI